MQQFHAVEEAVMRQNGDSTMIASEGANDELLEAPASRAIH